MENKNNLWSIPLNSKHNKEKELELQHNLHIIFNQHKNSQQKIKFACSLGAEDIVLLHAMQNVKSMPIEVFVLDTGRLHLETLAFMQQIKKHYALNIQVYTPDLEKVNNYAETHGLNAFYDSLERRKECCNIRKVEPLRHALSDACAWLTGQRQSQSSTRSDLLLEEIDISHSNITKYNPLFNWIDEDIWGYIQYYGIEIHPLHYSGYPSIGCEPCTRPIRMHENIRAGRWWWEDANNKECGLHIKKI